MKKLQTKTEHSLCCALLGLVERNSRDRDTLLGSTQCYSCVWFIQYPPFLPTAMQGHLKTHHPGRSPSGSSYKETSSV